MPPSAPDVVLDPGACREARDLPVNPFVANRYHFGMLLGVDDLETEQGYHRGKTWLHSAWLHGAGVVCGLRVVLRPVQRELAVLPGLALDRVGRELALDREHCLDLGRWFAEERPPDLEVVEDEDGLIHFTVHVTVAAHACADRPVPAISEPCEGASVDTALSRTVEVAALELRPGPAPAVEDLPYGRLRQLFGLAETTDDEVAAAMSELAASSAESLPADLLAWFRRFAAEDVMELAPGPGMFGHDAGAPVALAQVDVVLRRQDDELVLVGDGSPGEDGAASSVLDNRVRPSHVATSTIQELLCGPSPSATPGVEGPEPSGGQPEAESDEGGPAADGPRIDPASARLEGRDLRFRATGPLHERSVQRAAFEVTVLHPSGWRGVNINNAKLSSDDDQQVELRLNSSPSARPLRVVVRGTGGTPVVGADFRPVAGIVGGPPGSPHDGRDAAFMIHD